MASYRGKHNDSSGIASASPAVSRYLMAFSQNMLLTLMTSSPSAHRASSRSSSLAAPDRESWPSLALGSVHTHFHPPAMAAGPSHASWLGAAPRGDIVDSRYRTHEFPTRHTSAGIETFKHWRTSVRRRRGIPGKLTVSETFDDMVIYHSCRLHKGVTDDGTNEPEAASSQFLAHRL